MRNTNRRTILSTMIKKNKEVYTSSELYKFIGDYNSSDLSARLNDLFHMGMVRIVKTRGKNLYYLTEIGSKVSSMDELNSYIGGLNAYIGYMRTQKKTRAESEAKKQAKDYNIQEKTPRIIPTTLWGKLQYLWSEINFLFFTKHNEKST